jgi:16S rRNA (adenine1518-N6/adenine1519-N6)-dimethyltransferase|tara:strand:- start:3661 stop:4446 length:786 start_codon:yes stop_codon:yes gene_type:complete
MKGNYKEVEAKKYLGQHFLKDENVCKSIANTVDDFESVSKVVEVGPGMGAITKYLIKKEHPFSVIEVDGESITYLRENYPELDVVDFNFLKLDLGTLNDNNPFSLIGNFPYFISAQILTKIFDNRSLVSDVVGMFQKEVVEKVMAKPGKKNYGIISVLLQAFYDMEYLFTVDPKSFDPPPNVQSGVIKMTRNSVIELPIEIGTFKQVVKLGFNKRRKTLRNSLKSILPDEIRDEEIFSKRPEQLEVQEFIEIGIMIEKNRD